MANFCDHIAQARHNYNFSKVLSSENEYYDWRVTVNFYICIHLINAILAYEKDAHYRRHKDVEKAINPFNGECAIPQVIFLSYKKLHNLSRRSRYLIHEDNKMYAENCVHHTSENHYNKSVNRLSEIATFFEEKYKVTIIDKVTQS